MSTAIVGGIARIVGRCGGGGLRSIGIGLTAGGAVLRRIHLHIVHADPAADGGADHAPCDVGDGFLTQDLHHGAGVQCAGDVGVLAGDDADTDLVGDGTHILVIHDGFRRGGGDRLLGGSGGVRHIQIEGGSRVRLGLGVVLLTAGEHTDYHKYDQNQAQTLFKPASVGEIHGVTSLSSHFSNIL